MVKFGANAFWNRRITTGKSSCFFRTDPAYTGYTVHDFEVSHLNKSTRKMSNLQKLFFPAEMNNKTYAHAKSLEGVLDTTYLFSYAFFMFFR